jgi:hypothetical protein
MTDHPLSWLLAEYPSSDEHTAHARFAELVSQFHFKRAAGIRARSAGNVAHAQLYENEAARLSREIESQSLSHPRTRSLTLDDLPSLFVGETQRQVADQSAEQAHEQDGQYVAQ